MRSAYSKVTYKNRLGEKVDRLLTPQEILELVYQIGKAPDIFSELKITNSWIAGVAPKQYVHGRLGHLILSDKMVKYILPKER